MTNPSSEATVRPEASHTPLDHMTRSAGHSDHAESAASRRAWFPPSIEDFEITPEAAMYAGRR